MKPYFYFLFFLLMLSSLVGCTQARNTLAMDSPEESDYSNVNSIYRSYSEAKACAVGSFSFLNEDTKGSLRDIVDGGCVTVPGTRGAEKDTLFYYFNKANRGGFTIVNAYKNADPFICVTEAGRYDPEQGTGVPAVDFYLKNVEKELTRFNPDDPLIPEDSLEIRPHPYSYYVDVPVGSSVGPLLTTKWGGTGVFGAYCNSGQAYGCATAIAQIMAYHEEPSVLIGYAVANGLGYGYGDNIYMPWDDMKGHIKNHTESQSCDSYHSQISALLADINARINIILNDYDLTSFAPTIAHYGYTTGSLSSANVSTITASLDLNRPVLMYGADPTVGGDHVWVADGYNDYLIYRNTYQQQGLGGEYYLVSSVVVGSVQTLHINWGWQGDCDGYFNFNCYDTSMAVCYDEGCEESYDLGTNVLMIPNIYY